jgi:hypothetical protein
MTTRTILAALLLAAPVAAQQPAPQSKTPASQQKAAPVTKAADTKAGTTRAADTKTPPTTKAAPVTKAADTRASQTKAADTKAGAGRPGIQVAPEAAVRPRVPVILREVYAYDAEGRRDPFVTLLTSDELRPTVADLRLVGVLLDPVRPIAVMREVGTNTQYRVTTGMKIGRMKVAMIKRRSVIFSIEEFGLNRMDSVVLGDTTKVRAR